ncbi:MAG: T9SS type A sorting domain-containing protein [Bacteroidales bacterium]|nr:T9SS type A sorting domain-containing protein [Bacteroidales bacterium]
MKNFLLFSSFILIGIIALGQSNFSTSLHATREGKGDAYKVANGGMELITGIPMEDLSCKKCHSTTEHFPNGDTILPETYAPSCADCHDFNAGTAVAEQTCLNCHNRQVYERAAYPGVDVHQAAGMVCVDCHSKEELHGDDGVAYVSLKQEGAIKVACEDCHSSLSGSHHTMHSGKVDCAACHAVSVLTCASCHFESLLATGKNRAINQIKNYKLLVKKDGLVRLGGFMTHTYDGKTNYIISSYHSHAIAKNATECSDCHHDMGGLNAAIEEYNTTGFITMTTWNAETKKIAGPTGIVPIPGDWKTALKLDFATYTGDPNIFPSDPTAWEYLKSEVDNSHLYFAEPLDSATMAKLGFTRFPSGLGDIELSFTLLQNYPNPFTGSTKITYQLKKNSIVSFRILDTSGRQLNSYSQGQQDPGSYEFTLPGEGLPSGILYCVMEVDGKTSMNKILHL